MRIGYYITRFLYRDEGPSKKYQCGGGEIAVYNLAVNMASRGHEISVFTSSANSRDSVDAYDGITVYRYATRVTVQSTSISPGIFLKPQKYPLDIVHGHLTVPPASYAAALHAKRRKLPLILTYHSEQQSDWGSLLRRTGASLDNTLIKRALFPSAKAIISFSEYYITQSKLLGAFKDKTVFLPNGVSPADYDIPISRDEARVKLGLPSQGQVLLFVGALSPHKNPDLLVKALPKVLSVFPEATLVLVGDGPMRADLEEMADKLGVRASVRFPGIVDSSMMPLHYRSADAFVLPSTVETFGLVVLEACASGLPVIVSSLPTFRTMVEDGINGIIVENQDESAFAEAMIQLLGDDELGKTMSQNAKQRANDFSWQRIAEETEELYSTVLAG
jgi:glycosyltransferase involved in cell wall biosynthesis